MVVLIMVLRDFSCVASRCVPGVHGQCLRRAPPGGQGLMNRKAPRCSRAPRVTQVTPGRPGHRVPPRHTTRRTSVHRLLRCSVGAVTTATVPASSMNAAPSHDDCQDNILPSAHTAGSPEEAIDCACDLTWATRTLSFASAAKYLIWTPPLSTGG